MQIAMYGAPTSPAGRGRPAAARTWPRGSARADLGHIENASWADMVENGYDADFANADLPADRRASANTASPKRMPPASRCSRMPAAGSVPRAREAFLCAVC